MYRHTTIVRLPDADAAGILFFGNYFRIAHDAYETFMGTIGFPFAKILKDKSFLALIAHAEADYLRPLPLGEEITVALNIEQIQRSSFTIVYLIKNGTDQVAAKLKTIHVVTDNNGNSQPIPDILRTKLEEAMK